MGRVLGFVLLLLVLFGGYQAYQVMTAAPARPVAPAVPTATAIPTSPEAAASFDHKVTGVATQLAGPARQPVHLVLTEQEIASKIQQSLPSSQDFRDVSVTLGDGTATLHGTAAVGGMDLPVEATIRLGADRGLLTVEVVSLKALGLALPETVKQQLLEQVKQSSGLSDPQALDLHFDVQSVQVTAQQVVIDGQTR